MSFKSLVVSLSVVAAALVASGCTRSLLVTYAPGAPDAASVAAKTKQKIAVLPFSDERSWVDKTDEKTMSFVAKQGVWKFGLGYDNKEYVPVSNLVQTLFVKELNTAGYDAFGSATPSSAAKYNVSGRIVTFEFENETGFVTVTSRRSVSVALTVSATDGSKVVDNVLFVENDRENEGMGVLHSTNVDKLMNKVFKKVVTDVMVQLRDKLAAQGINADFTVTLNGVPVNGSWAQNTAVALN